MEHLHHKANTSDTSKPLIEIKDLKKIYHDGGVETRVLKGIDLTINRGEFIAIMGRSGAGKSTFMYQMSLLDHPSSGSVMIDGKSTELMNSEERANFRLNRLGYVFQDYALLPELTALENVSLPLMMQGHPRLKAEKIAQVALEKVGLGHRLNNLPSKMSGGEQQRVSISRAIAHNPEIIFADEPTANLDSESSKQVIAIFKDLHSKGQTIIMVTHEHEYGKMTERIIELSDGTVIKDSKN